MKRLSLLSSFVFALTAQAAQIPAFMVGTWTETDRTVSERRDVVSISADGKFAIDMYRQVGKDGDAEVPNPTLCRYRYEGVVDFFGPATQTEVEEFRKAKKQDPIYRLGALVSKVQLLSASNEAKVACEKFVAQQDAVARTADGLYYSWLFRDLSDNVLIDTWYSLVYLKN